MIEATKVISLLNKASQNGTACLFAINYKMTRGIFIGNPLDQKEILFRVGNISNINSSKDSITLNPHPESLNEYKEKFEIIQKHLHNGNSFLANLTIKTPIDLAKKNNIHSLSLKDITNQVASSSTPYILYCPQKFVCFSPETFVRIDNNNNISSYPMKGTIDANLPNARETILNDYKETAEHSTIVDFIRSDLARVATNITVDKFRFITKVSREQGPILQVSSEISGNLFEKYRSKIGDTLLTQLPAGSICGAPKASTCKAIDQAEKDPDKRGYYSGIMGYYDGKDLDSAVMIRFIEENNNIEFGTNKPKYFFRSGGGITINSSLISEYQEAIDKIYLPQSTTIKPMYYIETICINKSKNNEIGEIPLRKYHLLRVKKTGVSDSVYNEIEKIMDKYAITDSKSLKETRHKLRIVYSKQEISEVSCCEYHIRKIAKLKLVEAPEIHYEHKYLNRKAFDDLLESLTKEEQNLRNGFTEIIITQNGALTDMRYANIVLEDHNGNFFTPDTPLLQGTRRAQLLETNIIKERHITISDFNNSKYKAVHMINGMMGIGECVIEID